MNYDEIKTLALSYSDRSDTEVTDRMDNFIKIVESRINRFLMTMDMTTRAFVLTVEDQQYYRLPADFNGLRDIEVKSTIEGRSKLTHSYLNPEQMNAQYSGVEQGGEAFYTIIADQIQVWPTAVDDMILEIVYYKKVPNLNAVDTENWISLDNPDCYTFGLMTEISAFTKDVDAFKLWDARFKESLGEIDLRDEKNKWSGTPLQTRVG